MADIQTYLIIASIITAILIFVFLILLVLRCENDHAFGKITDNLTNYFLLILACFAIISTLMVAQSTNHLTVTLDENQQKRESENIRKSKEFNAYKYFNDINTTSLSLEKKAFYGSIKVRDIKTYIDEIKKFNDEIEKNGELTVEEANEKKGLIPSSIKYSQIIKNTLSDYENNQNAVLYYDSEKDLTKEELTPGRSGSKLSEEIYISIGRQADQFLSLYTQNR